MKILAIQNRMGIGDTVIFLPFIKVLSEKYNSRISILVKESSKADQFLYQTNYIDKIHILERDEKSNSRHSGILGSINLIKDLKKQNFDLSRKNKDCFFYNVKFNRESIDETKRIF